MNTDTTMHAKNLTRLSSREQLSALMDGALSPDETRFLLRRLQHDASLAECWERWRLTGEVMRGLAPAQRLPADFATRVAASLHGGVPQSTQVSSSGTPGWLRWGGGAAMAASLAVAALVIGQPGGDAPAPVPGSALAATSGAVTAPAPRAPSVPAAEAFAAAGALAAVARPARTARRNEPVAAAEVQGTVASSDVDVAPLSVAADSQALPLMAQPDIVTRPWPRSVLPQYAEPGLVVGFGNQGGATYNLFQAQAAPATGPADAGNRDALQALPVVVEVPAPSP